MKETDTEMGGKLGELYNCPGLQSKEFTGHKKGRTRAVSLCWGDELGV